MARSQTTKTITATSENGVGGYRINIEIEYLMGDDIRAAQQFKAMSQEIIHELGVDVEN